MSVRKIGKVWSYRVDVGKNPSTGKRKQVYRGGFPTKKSAEYAKAEFLTKVNSNGYFSPSNETFKQFILSWLEIVYKNEVQSTTFEKTFGIVNYRILPAFQYSLVNEIKPFDLQQFFAKQLKEGLSPSYVKTMHNILNKAFKTAIIWEIINKNPLDGVKSPSIKRTSKETWNAVDIKKFLEHCLETRWRVAFSLAINTGIRRGELLALKWNKVDFVEKSIFIDEALAYTKKLGLFFKQPKTNSSIRKILIPDSLVDILKELKEEQEDLIQRMRQNYHVNDLVICTIDGKPIHPRNLVRKFKETTKKAGLFMIPYHGLRHTNATLLMKKGVNPKIVSERLGHSNVAVTLGIYSHTDLEIQKRATESLDSLFINHKKEHI